MSGASVHDSLQVDLIPLVAHALAFPVSYELYTDVSQSVGAHRTAQCYCCEIRLSYHPRQPLYPRTLSLVKAAGIILQRSVGGISVSICRAAISLLQIPHRYKPTPMHSETVNA